MRIAFDPMVAARSAALILHVRTWTAAHKPLKAQAAIGWPETPSAPHSPQALQTTLKLGLRPCPALKPLSPTLDPHAIPQVPFLAISGEKLQLASQSPARHSPARASLRSFSCETALPFMLLDRIKESLLHYFTWWNGANFHTSLYTRRCGA